MTEFSPIIWWYMVTLVATLACWPLTLFLFRNVMGRGAGFARPLACIVGIWPAWFLASILGESKLWTRSLIWALLLLAGTVLWTRFLRGGGPTAEELFHFVIAELVFLAVFIGGIRFRGFTPQILNTEKPSELMMLSSVMHGSSMPPIDAWLSGHSVNYYYFGYTIWGGFGKMADLAPAQVFNLALATTFAMAFVAVSGLVAMILGRFYGAWSARIGGVLAALITLFIGNPWSSWHGLTGGESGSYWSGIGWRSSRIYQDAIEPAYNSITEFPAFSFILGDLHPHVMALPFVALALGVAWVLLTLGQNDAEGWFGQNELAMILLSGFLLGSLYALNSWDFPTFGGIASLALLLGTIGIGFRRQLGAQVALIMGAVLPWLPFLLNFDTPVVRAESPAIKLLAHVPILGGLLASIRLNQSHATSSQEFFSFFGFQYAIMLVLIVMEVYRRREPLMSMRLRREGYRPSQDPMSGYFAAGFGVICLIGAIVVPIPILVLCGLPVIIIWLLLERDTRLIPANVALMLYALAFLLLLLPEFFYIADIYGGSRMNTVFKVTYQVWFITSVASAIALVSIWKSVRRAGAVRFLMPALTTLTIAAALVYPVVGGQQWIKWSNPTYAWQGIDGLAYLRDSPNALEVAEYAAITWLRENATDSDVILTAGGGEWKGEVGRLSGGSGVPTIIGWAGHERQWHLGNTDVLAEISERVRDVDAMYAAPPDAELLDNYGVTLLYIGPNEIGGVAGVDPVDGYMSTIPIPTANDPSYPGDEWELVFQHGDVRIYRRIQP